MAHHQERHHDRMHAQQGLSFLTGTGLPSDIPLTGEDDLVVEADEPPDTQIRFSRRPTPYTRAPAIDDGYITSPTSPPNQKKSLLTHALLASPDLMSATRSELPALSIPARGTSVISNHSNVSADSTAELTSDGGLTSPTRTATPSPPLPSANLTTLGLLTPKVLTKAHVASSFVAKDDALSQPEPTITGAQETTVEAGLGRKRCITFACGRQPILQDKSDRNTHANVAESETQKPADQPKRPSALRFACPNRPSEAAPNTIDKDHKPSHRRGSSPILPTTDIQPVETPNHRQHRDSASTVKQSPAKSTAENLALRGPRTSPVFDQRDLEGSAATRFHEFASSIDESDEWMLEQTAHRSRLTVNDTLRKENAIRQLGEEAEAEALEEEEAEEEAELEQDGDDLDASDGGNETDDEDGFADSDDESDGGSEYQFWTTGVTTAATSTDHLDHFRPTSQRTPSESSIESIIRADQWKADKGEIVPRGRRTSRAQKPGKMRPTTPDLPDSTDFVCGTLDEDRPLEAAYLSCLEQRRRSKHKTIPQDIDPSFPTSDPEEKEDDDHDAPAEESDEHVWIAGQPDNSDDERPRSRMNGPSRINHKSPPPSPARLRSPPPPKRGVVPPPRLRSPPPPKRCMNNRSPPPRDLFCQSPRRRRSPPLHLRILKSPPPTRRDSLAVSPRQYKSGIDVPCLAQRPDLTHTKSLPRTPNPFWVHQREARQIASDAASTGNSPITELHNRGPIDIAKGLENRRQRRKEKFWRQHCRNAGKDKERRCQPGKGAERMRELGLEIAGKGKGHGQKAQLVLSI
ncbi:hypothetical protein MMC08_000741 [Hypocenomyce scalaris]|nr:hypothetical protein [Hypocenomyce scalaris]